MRPEPDRDVLRTTSGRRAARDEVLFMTRGGSQRRAPVDVFFRQPASAEAAGIRQGGTTMGLIRDCLRLPCVFLLIEAQQRSSRGFARRSTEQSDCFKHLLAAFENRRLGHPGARWSALAPLDRRGRSHVRARQQLEESSSPRAMA